MNKKLIEKAGGFGDSKTSYIRVPMGPNFGNQPGQPYVLEIWPKGHYSPIHNHGNSAALIKLLCGKLISFADFYSLSSVTFWEMHYSLSSIDFSLS